MAGFSPDARHLLIATSLGIELWEVVGESPVLRQKLPQKWGLFAPLFTPDGRYALAFGYPTTNPGYLMTWAVTTKGLVERDRVEIAPITYALSPDGKTVAAGNTKQIQLYDLTEGKFKPRVTLDIPGVALSFSPDSRTLAAGFQAVKLIDLASGQVTREFSLPEMPSDVARAQQIAYHPDGRHLFVVNANHTIYFLRLAPPPKAP